MTREKIMTRKATPTDTPELTTLLIGVDAPYNQMRPIQEYYDEFLSLAQTMNLKYEHSLFIKIRTIDKGLFFTKGKLLDLKKFCDENNIEEVIVSEILTPLQERNLEDYLNCTVWDREKLILEIFKKSAITAEGRIQVEMAEIDFLKSRLSGKGIDFAQQEGMIGGKGPGETAKEALKQYFAIQYTRAKKRLETLKQSREVQRKKRLESNLPLISLVGYTNAGKSSLLNVLTKSQVLVEDKLFATLDITTKELYLENKKIGLVSDTVGFISQLPHHLIEAFKSTLDELKYASLLLHVIDISNNTWQDQIKVVNNTLKELGIDKPILHVFNKIDKLTEQELSLIKLETGDFEQKVFIHTKDKSGIKELTNFLSKYNFKS
ncbi:MAG: GTPase HflX [candidate division TM6 bacterium GW2011_GWF2_28_16]|nr:MAG: GTPase HflX [candidate division TM6 bacterium GW2011_GWF2_28_16]